MFSTNCLGSACRGAHFSSRRSHLLLDGGKRMDNIRDTPVLIFVFSLIAQLFAASIGTFLRGLRTLESDQREEFGVIQGGVLTLLGLLIGFTFSMAVNRYDQRMNYEEAEANAIGTEYVRADLLPAADAARVRELLRNYLSQRILFYTSHTGPQLGQINASTAQLQIKLWATVQARAVAQPTPTVVLAVSGLNDVLNSQGYTQFAWWYRIPAEAWVLMAVIAIGCSVLIGYGAHRTDRLLFLVLPLAVSVSFFLIADIDSPRTGVIRVQPQDLISLSESLDAH
jgi:hypothetical protein